MERRTLLVIASVLVAAMGTALIWLYVQSADARARGKWQNLATVLVATEAIPVGAGTDFINQRTAPVQVPRDFVPAQPIINSQTIGTRTTTMPVLKGQYLVEGQFSTSNTPIGVPDNRMGVALSMDDPNRVASLLRPDSHVAVYGVATDKTGRHVQSIMPSVRVIAVGGTTNYKNADGAAAHVGTQSGVSTAMVTLDVAGPEAATLIAWSGSLYFTLLGKGAEGSPRDKATALLGANAANG